jgi:hypothetical protein
MLDGHDGRRHPTTKQTEPNKMKMKSNMHVRIAVLALSAATASISAVSASEWSKEASFGNDLLSAGYTVSASEEIGFSNYQLNAEASAWGKAFGTKATIASAELEAGANHEEGRIYGKFEVLGKTVWEASKSGSSTFSGTFPITQKEKTLGKATFMVGPIPVSLTAKMSVSSSIDYEGGVVGSSTPTAYGKIVPKFDVAGSASLGVDVVVAAAGVTATVNFLDVELPCEAGVERTTGTSFKHYWDLNLELESLSGHIDAWVRIGPSWPSWASKTYEEEIFKWTGFEKTYVIASGSRTKSLVMSTAAMPVAGLFGH